MLANGLDGSAEVTVAAVELGVAVSVEEVEGEGGAAVIDEAETASTVAEGLSDTPLADITVLWRLAREVSTAKYVPEFVAKEEGDATDALASVGAKSESDADALGVAKAS